MKYKGYRSKLGCQGLDGCSLAGLLPAGFCLGCSCKPRPLGESDSELQFLAVRFCCCSLPLQICTHRQHLSMCW